MRHPDPGRCEPFALGLQHGAGRPVGQDSAGGIEHDDPVDEVLPHGDPVFDHDQGRSGGVEGTTDGVAHLDHAVGVEVGGRLVEQEQARPHGQHAGEGEALFLAAAERGGGVIERQPQADRLEGDTDPAPDLVPLHGEIFATEGDVVADSREHDLGIRVLQHETDPATGIRRPPAVDKQFAGLVALILSAEHSGEGVHEGALARAARAEQQHAFARADVEVESGDRGRAPSGVPPAPAAGAHMRARDRAYGIGIQGHPLHGGALGGAAGGESAQGPRTH
ncbi:hypothetical protein KIV56_03695 [Cryobacterium breve]|uniref:Uncharacterized protein n=1 Tax=Cryobacterium breve TaxID=1259258 RepID=A0ABY7NI46_9MICO|nr:hypothetical protein KIV56_03695 [Cryobacterium breve]